MGQVNQPTNQSISQPASQSSKSATLKASIDGFHYNQPPSTTTLPLIKMNPANCDDGRCYVAFTVAAAVAVDLLQLPLPLNNNNDASRPPSPTASTISSHADSAIGESSCGSATPSPPSVRNVPTRSQPHTSQTKTLHITYSLISSGNGGDSDSTPHGVHHVELSANDPCDLSIQLKKLSQDIMASTISNCTLATRTEDIRQIFYPFVVASHQMVEMPSIFHRYVAIPAVHSTTNHSDQISAIREFIIKEGKEVIERRLQLIHQSYDPHHPPVVGDDLYVDNLLIARVRGLPWQASDNDIALFFAGLNIARGGIALCLSAEGRRSGEAIIRFESAEQRQLALQRHRNFLLGRYIEVYRGCGEDFIGVMIGSGGGESDIRSAIRFSGMDSAMILRMRGLPFSATEQQIRDFFSNRNGSDSISQSDSASSPENTEEDESSGIVPDGGILLVSRPDGRPSGDAFVAFVDEASGRRALAKHKQRIGTRYIEIFHTTPAEVQQLLNRSHQSIAPRAVMGQAPKRDCLRLRGLPYEAQVQQVVDFIGPYARHIIFQGVHMIYNAQAHPSGEALVRMDSEAAATIAAQMLHNKYMEVGKKKRYIEVFTQANSLPAGSGLGAGTSIDALALSNQHQFTQLMQQPALHQLQAILRATAPLNLTGTFQSTPPPPPPLFAQQSLLQQVPSAHQMCFQPHAAGLLPMPMPSFPMLNENSYAQQYHQMASSTAPFGQSMDAATTAALINLQQQQQQRQFMLNGGDLSIQQQSAMAQPNSQFSLLHS